MMIIMHEWQKMMQMLGVWSRRPRVYQQSPVKLNDITNKTKINHVTLAHLIYAYVDRVFPNINV